MVPTPSNIYRLLLYFSFPPYPHMPFPLNVSLPNYVYLVLLIPPHKSTLIYSLHCIHLFLLMRGTAECTVVDGHGRAFQDGAVVTPLHGTMLGGHSSEVHWMAQSISWTPALIHGSGLQSGFCFLPWLDFASSNFSFISFIFPSLNCK